MWEQDGLQELFPGTGEVIRPNALQWLRYSITGGVPAKNHPWVLYDVTCRTWALRHAAHYLVLVAPLVTLVMVVLPTSIGVRVETSFAAGASVFLGYLCFATESLERRAEKAGYPHGIAQKLRERRAVQDQRNTAARARARRDARFTR